MAKIAAKQGLYDPTDPAPLLTGTRCADCGATFFPPLRIGCEKCGSAQLAPMQMTASGVLHSVATVHMHMGKDIEAPFTVAEIALDDGPLIRGMLTAPAEIAMIGKRVSAQWVTTGDDDDGNDVVEPHFALTNEGDA